MQNQVAWSCAVLLSACCHIPGAQADPPATTPSRSARGLPAEKALADFYRPEQVQSIYLQVADKELKRMQTQVLLGEPIQNVAS